MAKDFKVKDSGVREEYASGMRRDTQEGKPKFSLLHPKAVPFDEQMWIRFAVHMSKGADKYGSRNWEKASGEVELERFKDSAYRHFMQWLHGEDDEDHAAATWFNIMAAEFVKGRLELKW